MLSLTLAAVFFVGIHLFVAGTRLRDTLTGSIGDGPYLGLFSLASLAGIVWLCSAYAAAPVAPLWPSPAWFRPVAVVLMGIAFLLAAIGITTPSPTSTGGERKLEEEEPARGILRVTRHPFLWGVSLWAAVHLVANGELADVVFFGALLVLGLAGPPSIDAKRARKMGEAWERFAARTSSLPFAAIASGRNALRVGELGWWRIALAIGLYAALLATHQRWFGVSAY